LSELFISTIPQNYSESKNGEKYSALESHALSVLSFVKPDLYDDNYLRLVSLIAEGAYQTMHANVAYTVYNDFLTVLQENNERTDWKYYQLYYNLCRDMIPVATYNKEYNQARRLLDKTYQVLDIVFSNEDIARDFWKSANSESYHGNELKRHFTDYARAETKISDALYYDAIGDLEIIDTVLKYHSGETKKLDTTKHEQLLLYALIDFVRLQNVFGSLSENDISDKNRECMKNNINSQIALIMLMLGNNDSTINILSSSNMFNTEVYLSLGLAYLDNEFYDESIEALNSALSRCKDEYGENHTLNISIRTLLSLCYKFKGILASEFVKKEKHFGAALQQINKCKALIAQNVSTKDTELVNEIYDELVSLSSEAMK
jgi:hypothetical protein